ncbi:unnamed protein product, partial [Ixodes hexagonus]
SLATLHGGGRFVTDCDCGPQHKGRSDASLPLEARTLGHRLASRALGRSPLPVTSENCKPVPSRAFCTYTRARRDRGLGATPQYLCRPETCRCVPPKMARAAHGVESRSERRAGAFIEPRAEAGAGEEAPALDAVTEASLWSQNMMRAPRCRRCPGNERRGRRRRHEQRHVRAP